MDGVHYSNVVRMNQIIHTGALLEAVGNPYSIIVFANTTVSMEVKPRIEVTLYNSNSVCISSPSCRLVMSTVVTLGKVVIFDV